MAAIAARRSAMSGEPDPHRVQRGMPILRNQHHAFRDRLCDDQMIKRVPVLVMKGQCIQRQKMLRCQGKGLYPARRGQMRDDRGKIGF